MARLNYQIAKSLINSVFWTCNKSIIKLGKGEDLYKFFLSICIKEANIMESTN